MYRDEGYLPEAMRNYLMLLGWAPPDDREIVPCEEIVDRVPPRGRELVARVLRREEARGVQRRVHPGDAGGGVRRRAQPWLVAPTRPGTPSSSTPPCSRRWPRSCRQRVEELIEVPAMVDFLFLDDAPDDRAAWAKAMKARIACDGARRAIAAYARRARGSADALQGRARRSASGRAQAGQGAGAGAGRHHRSHGRAPLFESLECSDASAH